MIDLQPTMIDLQPTIRLSDRGEKIYFYSPHQLEYMKNLCEVERIAKKRATAYIATRDNELDKKFKEKESFFEFLKRKEI